MIKVTNITSEAHQRHVLLLDGKEVNAVLRFLPTAEIWTIDIDYDNKQATGFKLSLNVLHMQSTNYPFDFTVIDQSGRGLDPYRIDDFSEGRVALYMFQRDDMELIRGQDVPI